MQQIQDYLQTQALNADAQAVAVARAAAQAVIAQGQAHIDRSILLHHDLPQPLAAQTEALKQLFMALDSVYSRHLPQSAVLYGKLPEDGALVRLAQQGRALENRWDSSDDSIRQSLAARTARSGWANLVDDTDRWLQNGELSGTHNRRAAAQTSLPVCGEDGSVYGVLHIETAAVPDAEALADWIGLGLGVLPLLRQLLPQPQPNEESDHAAA